MQAQLQAQAVQMQASNATLIEQCKNAIDSERAQAEKMRIEMQQQGMEMVRKMTADTEMYQATIAKLQSQEKDRQTILQVQQASSYEAMLKDRDDTTQKQMAFCQQQATDAMREIGALKAEVAMLRTVACMNCYPDRKASVDMDERFACAFCYKRVAITDRAHELEKDTALILEYISERVIKCLRRTLLSFIVSQEEESRYEGKDIELQRAMERFQKEQEAAKTSTA